MKKEIGKINGEIRFLGDLLKIGEPMQIGECSEPLVEPATILCGDEGMVLILINHNLDFKEERPICEEYYPPIPVTNDFYIKIKIPQEMHIQDVFEVGNKCERAKFIEENGYINIVVDGIEVTRQYVLTTDPQLYYRDSNRNGKSDLKELSRDYQNDEFDILNTLKVLQKSNDVPDIQFPETQYNFGTVDIKDKVTHKFLFKNVGKNDLIIKDVVTRSNNVDVKVYKEILLSEEESNVEVTLNTGEREGVIHETIYIYTNDIDEAEVKLQIGGTVKKAIVYFPDRLYLGDIQMGQGITKEIKILGNLRITKADATSEYLICEILRIENRNPKENSVKVILKPEVPGGEINAKIKIYTNNPKWPFVEIPVTGRVKEDIQLFPTSLFFGFVRRGSEVTKKITILSNSEKRLEIVGIKNSPDYIAIDSITKKSKNEYEIIAKFKSVALAGVVKGDLDIQTNSSNQNILKIPFYAVVK